MTTHPTSKIVLLACGATLLVAGSGSAGSTDDQALREEARIQRQSQTTPDFENVEKGGGKDSGSVATADSVGADDEEAIADDRVMAPAGEHRMPGETTSGTDDAGTGAAGATGSGATGTERGGHVYDEQGDASGRLMPDHQ